MIDVPEMHERLRADPLYADLLAFCNEHGYPPSYVEGRTWPNPNDPEEPFWLPAIEEPAGSGNWTPGDWEQVQAYRLWTRSLCRCGLHDLDVVPEVKRPQWKAVSKTCPGCAAVSAEQDRIDDAKDAGARRYWLEPVVDVVDPLEGLSTEERRAHRRKLAEAEADAG